MNPKIFVLISILINIVGQYTMKYGMNRFGTVDLSNIPQLILKLILFPYVIVGLAIYGVSAFFWIVALSKVDLSTAYPMLSIGYVLIMLVSYFFLNESMGLYKILGTLCIVLGIVLISR